MADAGNGIYSAGSGAVSESAEAERILRTTGGAEGFQTRAENVACLSGPGETPGAHFQFANGSNSCMTLGELNLLIFV